ncbi:MAG TPA: phospholipase D family protein [bacterium]|nr:phospholipase D family protein [bacterium]
MTTRFLSNQSLWNEVLSRLSKAKDASVAVAYLGGSGTQLLPLRRGHRLVVDMSLGKVKQGITDPREVRRLVKRGVKVYSRASLHAKLYIADRYVIASSANASTNSRYNLDEAGILTDDPAAARRARAFIDRICTEPVRPEYLKKCIAAYRPPKGGIPAKRGKKRTEPKLWFIGGLVTLNLSEEEKKSIKKIEDKVSKKLRDPNTTEVTWIRYRRMPKYARSIRPDEWIIDCMKDGKVRRVFAPSQVLSREIWNSPSGKKYHLLMLESSISSESIPISYFRKLARNIVPELDKPNPRTRSIINEEKADALLGLWNHSGRLNRRKKK